MTQFPLNFSHAANLNSSHPTQLTQFILHNSSHSIRSMQLTSHNSTHPTHFTPSPHPTRLAQFNSLNTPHSAHLTQAVSHNSSHTTQLTQLISLHSNHSADLTQLALLNSWNWGARGDSLRNTRCCTFIIIWSYLRTNFNPTSHLPQLLSYTHHHTSLHTSRLTILRSWQTWFHMWGYPVL